MVIPWAGTRSDQDDKYQVGLQYTQFNPLRELDLTDFNAPARRRELRLFGERSVANSETWWPEKDLNELARKRLGWEPASRQCPD